MEHIFALLRGFGYAFRGIMATIRTQRNMRIHLNAVALVVLVGILARLPAWKWTAVVLCFGLVTALELLNTAVEMLCNRVTAEFDPAVGRVKDAAAGAVLAAAIASVVVALLVFCSGETPAVLGQTLRTHHWAAVLLVAAVLLSVVHVLFLSARGTEKGKEP